MTSIKYLLEKKQLILIILLFTLLTRLIRIDYPNGYVFDEVYHAFTAKEYLKGSKAAWDPFASPPAGVAYEWTHPPLAKELMTVSMFLVHSTDAWAWRIPGVLLGVLSVYLVYCLGLELFYKDKKMGQTIALVSAFLYSVEGLNFVQSRTGMNDSYFVAFSLLSVLMLLRKKYNISAIALGLALASKWAAIYLIGIEFILLIYFKQFKKIYFYIFIPPIIYFFSYLPYFLLKYSIKDFFDLHYQMWWYHTHLKATHDYSSPAWSWPLNLYPVWYFVDYRPNGLIANIFASGNPLLFWMGISSILLTIWDFIKNRKKSLLVILLGFFLFWLPWLFSPRIMFLYHFSPSVPFLCLSLGYQFGNLYQDKKNRILVYLLLSVIFINFVLIYPMLTGIPLPRNLVNLFFDTNLTKNPFR